MKCRSFVHIYFTAMLLLLLIGTIAACYVIKYENPELSNISFNTLTHYKMNLKGQDNDIVLIGDSALLMGVIPHLVEEVTGHTVINLGLYGNCGVTALECLLDRYLAKNRKPSVIVIYFAASTPYFFADQKYEKTYSLIKYSSLPLQDLSRNISVTSIYVTAWTIFSRTTASLLHRQKSRQRFQEEMSFLEAMKGFGKNPSAQSPLSASFNVDSRQNRPLDLTFIKTMRTRYERRGIRVLFHIAPMPAGDRAHSFFQHEYAHDSDNIIELLPDRYFTDHTHMTLEGARLNSYRFAEVMKRTLCSSRVPLLHVR
ncbi:MAG: hypothetical protein HXX11_01935 [Desulfuromonadales bacterium]|nr:hypothetical protein [Desulfuromonadales bacterium]